MFHQRSGRWAGSWRMERGWIMMEEDNVSMNSIAEGLTAGQGKPLWHSVRKHVLQDVTMKPLLPLFWLRHQHNSYQLPKGVGNKTHHLHILCRFTEQITLRTYFMSLSHLSQINDFSGQGCSLSCGLDEGHLGERWSGAIFGLVQ